MTEPYLYFIENMKTLVNNKREEFITSLDNQSMIYKLKKDECDKYLLDENPSMDEYPFLKAEQEEYEDVDINTTINRILDSYSQTNNRLALIEKYRRRTLLQLPDPEIMTFTDANNMLDDLNTDFNSIL